MAFKASVNLQVRGGSAGVIESFYGVVKPITILSKIIEIKPSGKIVPGTTEIPFSIILRNPKEDNLERFYETFHGTNISIKDTQRHHILPELKSGGFRITGRISTQCLMLEPLSGELTVEASSLPICSIDIHLLCVESILLGEKIITETSFIQTTQVADGDVCHNMTANICCTSPPFDLSNCLSWSILH
ncbi:hypothetical protein CRYUN_Cryun19dG0054800 [Craigia yunnanensis]